MARPHPTQETAGVLRSQPIRCSICKPALRSAHLGCLVFLLLLFPLPAALQLLTSLHRRLQNPLSKKMHTGSCINGSTNNELLLTLLVLDPFPVQQHRLDFSVSHLPREIFFFNRTWVLELLRLVLEAQFCLLLAL